MTTTAEAPKGATTTAAASPEPGNLSTRQLASMLAKTAPASPAGEKTNNGTAEPEAKGTSRERSQGKKPKAEATPQEPKPENPETQQEQTEETERTEEQQGEGTEQTEQPEQTEQTEETAEQTETEATEQEPRKGELPQELKDAMELAKADGKKGTAELLKRVHKLVDERDTQRQGRLSAEEQLGQLRTELQQAKAGKGTNGAQPVGLVHPEVQKLNDELANVDYWLGWLEQNPDGGVLPDGKTQLDEKGVKKVANELNKTRQTVVAQKVQTEAAVQQAYQGAYKEHHAAAVAAHPWLKNPQSPEHQEMERILQAFPQLRVSPDFELVLGDMFRGRAVREAEAKGKKTPIARKVQPSREPTRVPTEAPGGARDTEPKGDKSLKDAEEKFNSSGKTADLAKQFAARRRAGLATAR